MSELKFTDDSPYEANDKAYRDVLRSVERNGQTLRIPVSMNYEVVGEWHHFYAMLELGFDFIEVIRCVKGALASEINEAKKISNKFPIRNRKHAHRYKDGQKIIKFGILPL